VYMCDLRVPDFYRLGVISLASILVTVLKRFAASLESEFHHHMDLETENTKLS